MLGVMKKSRQGKILFLVLITMLLLVIVAFRRQSQSSPSERQSSGEFLANELTPVSGWRSHPSSESTANVCPPCENQGSHSHSASIQPSHNRPASIQPSSDQPKWAMSSTTGLTFSGDVVHQFQKEKSLFSHRQHSGDKIDPWCEQWAVMTTIFDVSVAVRRQVKLRGWCLVVVFDKRSPKTYETGWMAGEGNDAVVYLRPDDHTNIPNIKSFVDALPWNHFGRKNIGYLYSIMHGAKVIWDFDDDNALKFWIPGAAPPGAPSIDEAIPESEGQSIDVLEPKDHSWPTYNPYPALGAPTLPSWPRGLPPDDIKVPDCSNTPLQTVNLKAGSIGVLQSLADYQPDVDAIFRLTMPVPFFFSRPKENKHLMIPRGHFTPYNAQATLHFKAGFFGLFLPITVSGRVTDIWRSYIAQRLFWDVGLQLGFIARPLVVQDRNMHSNIGDLGSEWDIYIKSKQMLEFLGEWKGKGRTIVERTEELWVALYERQYVELHDVELVQLWLQSLLDIGYPFPDLVDSRFSPSYYPVLSKPKEEKVTTTCSTTKHYTFWTSDLHDGPRIDTPTVLTSLGHTVYVAGLKLGRSPFPFVFQWENIHVYTNISKVIKNYRTHSDQLTEDMIKSNFEYYKSNEVIASTDAFFCSFPASYCELWMPFNKTIIFLPVHRYNLARCTKEEWDRLNEHLYMFAAMDSPKHIIGAASVYDQQYLHHYTGLNPLPLYSYTAMYTKNNPYNPTREEILYVTHMEGRLAKELVSKVKKFKLVGIAELYPHYELSDLVSHRAIVYFPYSVMSFKLVEYYGLAIPLFIPSPVFFKNVNPFGPDRSSLSRFYCKNPGLDEVMKPHPASTHPYSPNIEGGEDEYYWLQLSDFYQWPHITYFDDMQELERKLEGADFERIHNLMVKEVERKKDALVRTWCEALQGVETGRKVPQDYSSALQQIYGVSRLLVH